MSKRICANCGGLKIQVHQLTADLQRVTAERDEARKCATEMREALQAWMRFNSLEFHLLDHEETVKRNDEIVDMTRDALGKAVP